MRRRPSLFLPSSLILCVFVLIALAAATARGQASAAARGRFVDPLVQNWKIGVVVRGGDGLATGITATAPIPTEWPEQQVEIVDRDVSDNVGGVAFRDLEPGARLMVVTIPRLQAGDVARAVLTFRVTRSAVAEPPNPAAFVPIRARSRELAPFLAESPSIESRHVTIRKLADEVTAGTDEGWPQAQAIYDFVQKKLTYKTGELKGALDALRDGDGDCEAYTSLFVALCRAKGIPARTVWVPGHCYPEFYLEDKAGNGYWLPCQSAGDREFGGIRDRRPILQKGDSFRVPGLGKPQRYATPTMTARDMQGRTPPSLEFVQVEVPSEQVGSNANAARN